MFAAIFDFLKRANPFHSKYDLISDLNITVTSIEETTIPNLNKLKTVIETEKFKDKKNVDIIDKIYKNLSREVITSVKKNIGDDLLRLMTNVSNNAKYSLEQLEKLNKNVILTAAMSASKAFHVRAVGHYYFLQKYTNDLINYLYVNEISSIEEVSDAYKLKKIQIERIEKDATLYAKLISIYGLHHEAFRQRLGKIEDVLIDVQNADEQAHAYADKKLDIDKMPEGFVGSPIFAVRLIFAQWEADRYKAMKDEKKLLELRYLHLRLLKEKGSSDPSIEKELEYLQDKINKLEYKIYKMEKEVEADEREF